MENDLRYLARGLGYDGESEKELEKLFVEYNVVSQEEKDMLRREYEEGYFDW